MFVLVPLGGLKVKPGGSDPTLMDQAIVEYWGLVVNGAE
jgi:hypothetical protein